MGAGLSVADLYYPTVVLYQWTLAALVLRAGRTDAVRAALGIVLAMGGVQAFEGWARAYGEQVLPFPVLAGTEGLIVTSLVFVLSQVPRPLGGARGAAVARRVWVLAAALYLALVLAASALPSEGCTAPVCHLRTVLLTVHGAAFLAATALLVLHVIPAWGRLPPGPLRTQTTLIAVGIGLGLLRLGATAGAALAEDVLTGGSPFAYVTRVAHPALAFFAFAAVARAAVVAARTRARDAVVVTGLFFFAASSGLDLYPWLALPWEFVPQTFRPLLLGIAVLRYDLVRVPRALARPLVPVTAGLFAFALFVLVSVRGAEGGMAATSLSPAAATVAFAVVAGVGYAFRQAIDEVFRLTRGEEDPETRHARLERYRLALERAPSDGDDAELARLRRELGVTWREHDALTAVLDGHLVVPMTAIVGASRGTVVAGRYAVVGELGRGGQGRALRALDRETGQEVVLKEVVRPWRESTGDRRAVIEREAAAVRDVESPHVARVLDVIAERWQSYLVREFVPGDTLADLVARRGPLSPPRAAAVASDVLAGLEALHARGVLHLDLKPANVVVRPDGRAVVIDAGTASSVADADPDATLARLGADDALSLRWAAPERLAGDAPDVRTDLYQVGGLLYHALTGRAPVAGDAAFAVETAIRHGGALEWPSHVPDALRRIVEAARSVDPAHRPASAADLRSALRTPPRAHGAGAAR